MLVGVPKEIKPGEHRVGLVPASVREFVKHGHEVCVEAGAGAGIGEVDASYMEAGARIVEDAEEVFAASDLIIKVKEPQAEEWQKLREGQILFTYLHLAPDLDQTNGLLKSGVTAIAYETVTDADGRLPLLAPMSEVAGRLSIQAAARCLEKESAGQGLLLGGVPGVERARVAVIGGGVVGTNAAKMALGLGADVTILDRSLPRLRQLDDIFQGRALTLFATSEAVDHSVEAADVVIGAVLIPGASAPRLVTREHLVRMKDGAAIIDVAIDQGGCFETSHATTHGNPTYVVEGVVHYCVANMPGAVPRTSSYALNNATLPCGLRLADERLKALEDPHLLAGLNVHAGKVTNSAVAKALSFPFHEAEAVIR